MDNNSPKFSVVIPVYNQAQYLSSAIDSVLSQTSHDYELIVVDDGSTDNSREVVTQFGNQVRYIFQENKGLGGARNTGINAARGEFIGLLDADDQWLPTFLETMIVLTNRYPEASVYYCCAQSMDADGNTLPQLFGGPVRHPDMMYQSLLRANFLIPSTILARCSDIVTAGMFDQSTQDIHGCEDWDLWLRLALDHDFIGINECLVRYRLHGSSLSANPAGMQRAARSVIEKHFGQDDGRLETWSTVKRRAFGGVYRYHVLTSVHLQSDWDIAGSYLRRALQTDPTLSIDLDLFYDLAHANQPAGFRGSIYGVVIEGNVEKIYTMLLDVFNYSSGSKFNRLRHKTYGTANYALGLVAYKLGNRSLSRNLYLKALLNRPELWSDKRLIENLIKSIFKQSTLEKIKQYRTQLLH